MRIAVVGTGYVGLVSGVCLAEKANQVICVDIDIDKVERLSRGECTIYEPGLEVLLQKNIEAKRISFTTDLQTAVLQSDIIFLALPTPPDGDGAADLSYVLKVSDQIGKILKEAQLPAEQAYRIIIDKSTVPIGTADKVEALIAQHVQTPCDVVSNPEFLREGFAVQDFMNPDRVVIGTKSQRAARILQDLFEPYVTNPEEQIFIMDERSAEMTKYAANSYLAMRISFMNEIANLCEKVGADVDKVRIGIGSDTRIGKRFLLSGIGYGGSCFPKDVQALAKIATDEQYEFKILQNVMQVNQRQRLRIVEKMSDFFESDLRGKTIALWGIAFKPNTDDIREAPSLYIIEALLAAGANVQAYDPEAMPNAEKIVSTRVVLAKDAWQALQNADALAILTEWNEFVEADIDRICQTLRSPVIFDGRNIYSVETMAQKPCYYDSIGRRTINNLR
jgi:UDPglucose 6-dehydrogenase